MVDTTIITEEIDVHDFQQWILKSDAELLAPVAIYPDKQKQMPENAPEQLGRASAIWEAFTGPAGIGQFSLEKQGPVLAVARFNVYYRQPNQEESIEDIKEGRYSISGDSLEKVSLSGVDLSTNKFLRQPKIRYRNLRVKKVVLATRVTKNVCSDIQRCIEELDHVSETSDLIESTGNPVFFARQGNLQYCALSNRKQEYDSSLLSWYGDVEIVDDKLMFYSRGDRDFSQDFTRIMWRG
jgi:hypothetical protein